ncbi:MAG: tetratricopeptide (TPR) repeat protein [Gammaproteobacteria bacterium]|jgi:tetratricopeptide (TPR) repeat protein
MSIQYLWMNYTMNTPIASFLIVFALLAIQPVFADQTNAKLDNLFSDLKAAQNSESAQPIAQQIWALWLESEDQTIDELVAQGMNEVSKGDLARARELFTDITKRSPDYAEGWNKLATVDYMMGDIEASLKNIKETLKREPRHFGSISGRGLCYLKQRRWQSALIEFKAALDVHPWMLDARRNLKLLEDNLENHSI